MPYRQLPTTHQGAVKALDAANRKWKSTTADQRLITTTQFEQYLDLTGPGGPYTPGSLYYRYKKEIGESALALALQTPLTITATAESGLLRLTISHFLQGMNNAIARGDLPRTTRSFFQLPLESDRLPSLQSLADVLLWAQNVIDGEAARLAAAPPGTATALAWPSAAQIAARLQNVNLASTAQSTAKDHTDREERDVAALHPEVIAAITDLWDTIEFQLRHEPTNASRRRRAREWGVFYALRPDETPDEAEPPTEPPAGPTP